MTDFVGAGVSPISEVLGVSSSVVQAFSLPPGNGKKRSGGGGGGTDGIRHQRDCQRDCVPEQSVHLAPSLVVLAVTSSPPQGNVKRKGVQCLETRMWSQSGPRNKDRSTRHEPVRLCPNHNTRSPSQTGKSDSDTPPLLSLCSTVPPSPTGESKSFTLPLSPYCSFSHR